MVDGGCPSREMQIQPQPEVAALLLLRPGISPRCKRRPQLDAGCNYAAAHSMSLQRGVLFTEEHLTTAALGQWLAVLLVSLDRRNRPDPRTSSWEQEIEQAERLLFGEPQQGSSALQVSTPQLHRPFAVTTAIGFAEPNRSRVPSRTDIFRRKP